jgi:hypothetical protein
MRRAKSSSAVVLLMALACSPDSPVDPTPAPDGPLGSAACGLGPMSPPRNTPVPCSTAVGCPRVPPINASILVAASGCSFGSNATSCNLVSNPNCPFAFPEDSNQFVVVHQLLHNPDRPATNCTGEFHFRIERPGGSQIRILWDAQQLEEKPGGGCRAVGPHWDGEATIDGPCCQTIIDIRLPRAARTYRNVFRTDWNTIAVTSSHPAETIPETSPSS